MSTLVSEESNSPFSSLSSVHKKMKKSKQYALRECSIQRRKETERKKKEPKKRGPKPKPKSVPMSKYRRKTANMRERIRMGEINHAFENLRQKLPCPVESENTKCEKLTKINILHVAINYIRAMESLLKTGESNVTSFSEMTKNPFRDESESKLEMQKIVSVLMKKAEAKAAVKRATESDKIVGSSLSSGKARKSVKKAQTCDTNQNSYNECDDVDLSLNLSFNDWNALASCSLIQTDSPLTALDSVDPISPESGFGIANSDSFFNNIEPLHVFGQATEDVMKNLYSELAEMVRNLPEIVLEDNLDLFS